MGRFKTHQERMMKRMAKKKAKPEPQTQKLKGFRPKHLKAIQLKDPGAVKLGQQTIRQKIG